MDSIASAGNVAIENKRTCVLYDGRTGAIRHAHTVITLAGASPRDAAAIEKEAYQLASAAGRDLQNAEVLHVPGAPFTSPSRYKVDTTKRALVTMERIDVPRRSFFNNEVFWRGITIVLAILVIWLLIQRA